MQCERMDRPGELVGEQLIHQPVALHPGQRCEAVSHQRHLEVGLGARGHIVLVTFVLDAHHLEGKRRAQFVFDLLPDTHGRSPFNR